MGKKLFRSRRKKMIAGVCGGIGEFFGIDPTIIRLLWVIAVLAFGSGVLLYAVAWLIMPLEDI